MPQPGCRHSAAKREPRALLGSLVGLGAHCPHSSVSGLAALLGCKCPPASASLPPFQPWLVSGPALTFACTGPFERFLAPQDLWPALGSFSRIPTSEYPATQDPLGLGQALQPQTSHLSEQGQKQGDLNLAVCLFDCLLLVCLPVYITV